MAPMLCHLLQLQGPHCPHQCTHTEHIDAGLEKEKKKKGIGPERGKTKEEVEEEKGKELLQKKATRHRQGSPLLSPFLPSQFNTRFTHTSCVCFFPFFSAPISFALIQAFHSKLPAFPIVWSLQESGICSCCCSWARSDPAIHPRSQPGPSLFLSLAFCCGWVLTKKRISA